MNISQLNALDQPSLEEALTRCCGSPAWVKKMRGIFPVDDEQELLAQAEKTWFECSEDDWKAAFAHHPEIGDINALREKFTSTSAWAENEQAGVKQSSDDILEALAKGNGIYKKKFGYIFIVCATGKSAGEMLELLSNRLNNTPETELPIAMHEQNKITLLRLKKLLAS